MQSWIFRVRDKHMGEYYEKNEREKVLEEEQERTKEKE